MSKRTKSSNSGAMLDLWRPPKGAYDPIGCLSTTYTFAPGLFDEQCLARFLEIESEPDREDLAFLLERENKLGSVYAGVLVDHTQAGVEHSLRWDVLPVRIRGAKQHAKLSLLAWSRHVRVIVASANLTDPGYRTNYEVAGAVDLTPTEANRELLADAIAFLRRLLESVPGAHQMPPEISRAYGFLDQVDKLVSNWTPVPRRGTIRQQLSCTLPSGGANQPARSSLTESVEACRKRGGSPNEAWIASPFFDPDPKKSRATEALCKVMARGTPRKLYFSVPAAPADELDTAKPRLAAPKALILSAKYYDANFTVGTLPQHDPDKNLRPWHAKMLALHSPLYSAMMVGSSNFTGAGLGLGGQSNAEANLLTIVDRTERGRDVGLLQATWPAVEKVQDPDSAEWLGAQTDLDEEEQATTPLLPPGFLPATYRAGDTRCMVFRLASGEIPPEWSIQGIGTELDELLDSNRWRELGAPAVVEVGWPRVESPQKLLVRWGDCEAFLPFNVEDGRQLPPPSKLEQMTADDMLLVLAAADPSAAFRAWSRSQQSSEVFDTELDSATPIDLDPLRRYDLHATFLHRIRRRARFLAQLRANIEQPVWGKQTLEWKLRGLLGIGALADRWCREFDAAEDRSDEALLTLADFLIVLNEVHYHPTEASLPTSEFDGVYRPFLRELAETLKQHVALRCEHVSEDVMRFWEGVAARC